MHLRSVAVFGLVGLLLASTGCGGAAPSGPKVGKKTEAPEVMRKKCDGLNNLEGAVCYAKVADAFFEGGKRSEAEKEIDTATKKMEAALGEEHQAKNLIDALTTIAPVQYKVGKRDPARDFLKKAVALVDKVEAPSDKASRLVAIATGQHGIKRTPDAVETLKKAEELAGKLEDPLTKAETMLLAAGGYVSLERTGDADRLSKEALEIAKKIEDPGPKATALATVAGVLADMKKPTEATATFKEARAAAESVQDPFKRVFALGEVGKKMATARMYATGKEVLDATIELARQQKDQKSLEPVYRELERYILMCTKG
jgi:tetratricopeptide (TPR) repeat protein